MAHAAARRRIKTARQSGRRRPNVGMWSGGMVGHLEVLQRGPKVRPKEQVEDVASGRLGVVAEQPEGTPVRSAGGELGDGVHPTNAALRAG